MHAWMGKQREEMTISDQKQSQRETWFGKNGRMITQQDKWSTPSGIPSSGVHATNYKLAQSTISLLRFLSNLFLVEGSVKLLHEGSQTENGMDTHTHTHTDPWPFGGIKYRQQWMRWSSRGPRFTRDSSFKYSSNLVSMWLRIGCQLQGKKTTVTTFLTLTKKKRITGSDMCACSHHVFCISAINQSNTQHVTNSLAIYSQARGTNKRIYLHYCDRSLKCTALSLTAVTTGCHDNWPPWQSPLVT